jgi:hypothetical protein
MSDRIDHVARAIELGNLATENWNKGSAATAAAQIAGANAHATLALVEQQRIANIIAIGTARIAPDQPPPLRALVFELAGEYDIRPTEMIREALS